MVQSQLYKADKGVAGGAAKGKGLGDVSWTTRPCAPSETHKGHKELIVWWGSSWRRCQEMINSGGGVLLSMSRAEGQ